MARSILAVLALVALVAGAVAGAAVEDSFLQQRWLKALDSDPECKVSAAKNMPLTCDGCSAQVQCAKVANLWFYTGSTTCPSATPWCSAATGACTADVTQTDSTAKCSEPKPDPSFACPTAEGYFPNLQSCTKYYICSAGIAYAMDCATFPNTVYDHRTASCVARSSVACFSLTCPGTGSVVAYTPDPSIYAFCRNSKAADAALLTCPAGQTIDTVTGACKVACLQAGRRPVSGDNKAYTECVDLGTNKFNPPTLSRCPGSSVFKAATGRCGAP